LLPQILITVDAQGNPVCKCNCTPETVVWLMKKVELWLLSQPQLPAQPKIIEAKASPAGPLRMPGQ
jgi:hypothetical protein